MIFCSCGCWGTKMSKVISIVCMSFSLTSPHSPLKIRVRCKQIWRPNKNLYNFRTQTFLWKPLIEPHLSWIHFCYDFQDPFSFQNILQQISKCTFHKMYVNLYVKRFEKYSFSHRTSQMSSTWNQSIVITVSSVERRKDQVRSHL